MFPLHDDNPTEIFPIFTMFIIAACIGVWWYVQGAGSSGSVLGESICTLGAIPAEITGRIDTSALRGGPCELGGLTWQAVLTSMFLHGSWMHLIGNVWFLWIFGNNIEDSMGHLRFLAFYLLTGAIAVGAHVLADPASTVPVVGASGAISGIMGAYLMLYPRARIDTLVIIRVIPLPAWVMLGYWMALQIVGSFLTASAGGGGVAYAAHIGGFVAGLALILLFRNPRLVEAKRGGVVLHPHQLEHRGWW